MDQPSTERKFERDMEVRPADIRVIHSWELLSSNTGRTRHFLRTSIPVHHMWHGSLDEGSITTTECEEAEIHRDMRAGTETVKIRTKRRPRLYNAPPCVASYINGVCAQFNMNCFEFFAAVDVESADNTTNGLVHFDLVEHHLSPNFAAAAIAHLPVLFQLPASTPVRTMTDPYFGGIDNAPDRILADAVSIWLNPDARQRHQPLLHSVA